MGPVFLGEYHVLIGWWIALIFWEKVGAVIGFDAALKSPKSDWKYDCMGYFSGSLAFECLKCMVGENCMRYEILPEIYF